MWPRLKNSPHTYAHEGLESIFLFEFIELQWVQTDFLRLSDNNNFLFLIYSVLKGLTFREFMEGGKRFVAIFNTPRCKNKEKCRRQQIFQQKIAKTSAIYPSEKFK